MRVHACLVFVLFFALCDWVVLLVKQNARGLYDFTERSFSPSIPKPVHGPLQACLNQPPSRVGAILGWFFLFFWFFFCLFDFVFLITEMSLMEFATGYLCARVKCAYSI